VSGRELDSSVGKWSQVIRPMSDIEERIGSATDAATDGELED
jgi:hypothetical protein